MYSEQDGRGTIIVQSCRSSLIYDRVGISLPLVVLLRSSFSMSSIILLGVWGGKHLIAMVVSVIQDRRWWIGHVRKLWMEVWNRKLHRIVIPMLPFSRLQVTLLLTSSIISIFTGPSVAWRVWFRKFQKSQSTSHSFLMITQIHIFPDVFAPSDWRLKFWISFQLFTRSHMRACSQPISFWFSKALATANGRVGGGEEFFPFRHE